MDLGLRDRVVLITGAGGGAGPTVARAFADEGAMVALHQRTGPDRASRPKPRLPRSAPRAAVRIATPADLAVVVVWPGSAANTYVTGETISLHGGDQR